MIACYYGHTDIVKLLILKGVDVHQLDNNNQDALCIACRREQWDIVELLLNYGANPMRETKKGNSARMYMVKSGKEEMMTTVSSVAREIQDIAKTQGLTIVLYKKIYETVNNKQTNPNLISFFSFLIILTLNSVIYVHCI